MAKSCLDFTQKGYSCKPILGQNQEKFPQKQSTFKTLGFEYTKRALTTTDDSVQFHLYKAKSKNENIAVICFVTIEETICKLP